VIVWAGMRLDRAVADRPCSAAGHCISRRGPGGWPKTLMISTMWRETLSMTFQPHFNSPPDLMPADITGTEVSGKKTRTTGRAAEFPVFLEGPSLL